VKVWAGMDPRLPLRDIGAYAQRVEALGYDGLHVAETVHDSLMVALLAIEHTTRITVRTSVTLAFVRSPTLVAYTAWDLSQMSRGRFELGLGTQIRQNIEDRYGMPWSEPVARMRGFVDALDALYASFRTGERLHHDGPHYPLSRLQPYFNPGPDAATRVPPTWLGGVNAGIVQLAGEKAAGFVTHPTNSSPRYLDEICLPNLRTGAQRAGRAGDEVEVVAGTPVITGASDQQLHDERERQRRMFAFLYSTPAYRRTLELYGWVSIAAELQALIRADRWDDLARVITDEVLDALIPSAVHDELAPVLIDRFGPRVSGVVLTPPANPDDDVSFMSVLTALHAAHP